jgi:hypothetical protein
MGFLAFGGVGAINESLSFTSTSKQNKKKAGNKDKR